MSDKILINTHCKHGHPPAMWCSECHAESSLASGSGYDASILLRITNYLSNGGLFNPEMMEHNKVRELIMDCRGELATLYYAVAKLRRAVRAGNRLASAEYVTWAKAGGGRECEHGYNKGIHCPACDLALVNECLDGEHHNDPS